MTIFNHLFYEVLSDKDLENCGYAKFLNYVRGIKCNLRILRCFQKTDLKKAERRKKSLDNTLKNQMWRYFTWKTYYATFHKTEWFQRSCVSALVFFSKAWFPPGNFFWRQKLKLSSLLFPGNSNIFKAIFLYRPINFYRQLIATKLILSLLLLLRTDSTLSYVLLQMATTNWANFTLP